MTDLTGTDIGSDIGGLSMGTLLIAAGIAALIALLTRHDQGLIVAAAIAAVLAVYSAAAAKSHGTLQGVSVNGQLVPESTLAPHASLAWGVAAEAVAALVLLVAALALRHASRTRILEA